MLAVSNEGTPNLPTTIMSYSYDNVGNVLSMTDTINGSLGIATTREYDALNRLTFNSQGDKQVDYAYNAISQVITKYRYSVNNLVAETNNIYDNLNRLTNITHSNGTGAIASYSQTYDQGDRITGVTSNDRNSSCLSPNDDNLSTIGTNDIFDSGAIAQWRQTKTAIECKGDRLRLKLIRIPYFAVKPLFIHESR